MDKLLNKIRLQQLPPTTQPVSKHFWLFFTCRPETFLTATATNLSVSSDNTNPPVLHHVNPFDQSKPHNHSSVQSQKPRDIPTHLYLPLHESTSTWLHAFLPQLLLFKFSTIIMVRFILFFCFTIHYLTHTSKPPYLYPVSHPWHLHPPLAIHLI